MTLVPGHCCVASLTTLLFLIREVFKLAEITAAR